MLSPSKHSGQAFAAQTLRQAQGDSALLCVLTVLFCLLLSVSALAQTQNETAYPPGLRDVMSGNPLYIVNGKQIDDTLSKQILQKLDPKEIESISVLKGASAQALYGAKASNGVIIIEMKKDTRNINIDLSSIAEKDTSYIIDSQLSANKYNNIQPNNIVSITILKNSDVGDKHISDNNKVTVIVVTKPFAISQYQKKFSAFSEKYRAYARIQNGKDDSCTYFLVYPKKNAVWLEDVRTRITQLYNIPANAIKAVSFTGNQWYNGGASRPYDAIIVIKKQH